jgi:hypothetical protein
MSGTTPTPTPAPRPSRRRYWVLGAVTLVVVLGAGAGAAVLWVRSAWRSAEVGLFGLGPVLEQVAGGLGQGLADGAQVSVRFVGHLRAGRWHEAYQATSRGFRQKMDEASFTRFVKEAPPIKAPNTPININVVQGNVTVSSEGVKAPEGGVWLLLIGEDGGLKVEKFAVGDKTAP